MKCRACEQESDLELAYQGECKKQCADACTCGADDPLDIPICGTDGKTYPNLCTLKCKACTDESGVKPAHPGECESTTNQCDDACKCGADDPLDIPMCGSDGMTYPDLCTLECKACRDGSDLKPVYPGECEKQCDDACKCGADDPLDIPMCGSDGTTYPNLCTLECKACQEESDLKPVYPGNCNSTTNQCDDACKCGADDPLDIPMCGSDGMTYPDLCTLECKACREDSDLKPVYPGNCNTTTNQCVGVCVCPRLYDPVCGTDGKTYVNLCVLKCSACEQGSDLELAYPGECKKQCSDACKCGADDPIDIPMCGTDGMTYPNLCTLECKACQEESELKPVHPGNCKNV